MSCDIAIGITTCNREGVDVKATISQLRRGGFGGTCHVFCEPDTPLQCPEPDVVLHHNPTRLGNIGNWITCLTWLLDNTMADYLLVCEDDILLCRGASRALERVLRPSDECGFWSLYTPEGERNRFHSGTGWSRLEIVDGCIVWGAQALCFTRDSASLLRSHDQLLAAPPASGPTDVIVSEFFHAAGRHCFYHNPSLAQHVGEVSSIGSVFHRGLDYDHEAIFA